jgi:hypothetical protein
MYFKEQRYEKAKASTLASTHTVELPDTGLIDTISLQLAAVNDNDVYNNPPSTILKNITKIEVIGDNDKTLFSMNGHCAVAKAFRKMRGLPPFTQNGYGSKTQWQVIPILFGRKPHDGKYALDLSKWDKVELKVTNAFSSTYWASMSMETRLHTIEDSVEAHAKLLKQWEYQADKPVAAGDYIRPKLPTKGLLRELMIQLDPDLSTSTGAPTADCVGDSYNWKLWFKDRALTVFDHRPKDMMRDEHFRRQLGIGVSSLKPYPSLTLYSDFHWAYIESIVQSPISEGGADTTLSAFEDEQGRFQKLNFAGSAIFNQAIARGYGLFHTFAIPWFTEDEETEYLDLDRYKPVEIEWYGANYYNTHRIILEKPIGQGPSEYA